MVALASGVEGHRCIHDEIAAQVGPHLLHGEEGAVDYGDAHPLALARARARAKWERDLAPNEYENFANTGLPPVATAPQHLRVGAFYSVNDFTSAHREDVQNDLVPYAMAVLSTLLKVVPVQGALKMPRSWPSQGICSNKVQAAHQDTGVENADVVFYIGAGFCGFEPNDPSRLGVPAACASPCVLDEYGRTIGGAVELVESEMYAEGSTTASRRWILVHEIMHALGFSGPFAASFFKDPATGDPYSYDTLQVRPEHEHNVTRLVTPRVKEHARQHYGCDTLDGMEMEGQGGQGSFSSHWEARLVLNSEVMGPTTTLNGAVVSEMTLAFFEDSGHYFPAYEEGGHLLEGFRAGCALATQECLDGNGAVVDGGERMYCSQVQETKYTCTTDRMAKASCVTTTEWPEVPTEYQYYPGNPTRGGVFAFADFCPVVYPYVDGTCSTSTYLSLNPSSGKLLDWESGGAASRCFVGDIFPARVKREDLSWKGDYSYCFSHQCTNDGLEVLFDNEWLSCPAAGGRISGPTGSTGTLDCPPSSELCPPTFACPGGCGESDGFGCCNGHLGVCSCAAGRTGVTCSVVNPSYRGEAVAPTCRSSVRSFYTQAPTPAPTVEDAEDAPSGLFSGTLFSSEGVPVRFPATLLGAVGVVLNTL